MEIDLLERFNTWWHTGKVREEMLPGYKRRIFYDVQKYLKLRQAMLIYGLRRVGKSTLLYQLIDETLRATRPEMVLYFSFDERQYDLNDVLDTYQKMVLHSTFDSIPDMIYIFLDEVQKIDDWESKIKVIYDLYPNVKFVLSGSASIALRKAAKESLAGRIFDFVMDPLSFAEFLEMRGIETDKIRENPRMWGRKMLPLFTRYLEYGTFPELVNIDDSEIASRYINDNVLEKIIYKDLPESFGIGDVALLKSLTDMITKNPGMLVDYASIAKDLGKDQRTIANYFEYLEFGMIIRLVFNFRGSAVASRRKLKKVYLQTPNMAFASGEHTDVLLPKMYENAVSSATKAKFFYRNSFEVDFILSDRDGITGIEVKSTGIDAHQLIKLKKKYGKKVKKLVLLTESTKEKHGEIEIIPLWEYCLLQDH